MLNHEAIYNATRTLANRVVPHDGCISGATRIYNACMRMFDNKLPAKAVTFNVFYNAPVLQMGTATVYDDGRLECHLNHN